MEVFDVREDDVEIAGKVVQTWTDASAIVELPTRSWHVVVELPAGDPRLARADGSTNFFNLIDCRVTPVAPYHDLFVAKQFLDALVGQPVRVFGSWGDLREDGRLVAAAILPVAWIVVDRGITPFVEEHGFTQAVRDMDVFAFTDDGVIEPGASPTPHHGADRHLVITLPYPRRPQSVAAPRHEECVDREDREQIICFGRLTPQPRFPIHADRQHRYDVASAGGADTLVATIDTGDPAAGQGFFYAKVALAYDEGFDTMCDPNTCLPDPNQSCQATDESRFTYAWPTFLSARPGDLVLAPAGGNGVLGKLLGALDPPQHYDHMAMFVENDRQTMRHSTASDDRIADEEYYDGIVKVETPFGDVEKKLPLHGIRADALKYAWPGTITQTLAEVFFTGRNRSNPQFAFATLYADVIQAETDARSVPLLWQLDPAERDKRTTYHDPEAAGRARAKPPDSRMRRTYSMVRMQRNPAFRFEIDTLTQRPVGLIFPVLVQPHPFVKQDAYAALSVVADEAKKINAHYRFFAYSRGAIAIDATCNAPPPGVGNWGEGAGRDWAAGTVAAVCSSFAWAAVQAANTVLAASSRPIIELEGVSEESDRRAGAFPDGLYEYRPDERTAAAHALYDFTYNRVVREVDKAIDQAPGYVTALNSFFGLGAAESPLELIRDMLAATVANQLCNIFARDTTNDFASTWNDPSGGSAVSPDDTMRWDTDTPLDIRPPSTPGKISVYGNRQQIAIPRPAWREQPVHRILPVLGVGTVRGTVVRRRKSNEEPTGVAGATVRLGCQTYPTGTDGDFHFTDTETGTYDVQAGIFVSDPVTRVGVEWVSKRHRIELQPGQTIEGLVLELEPPPGVARDLLIESHHDIVDRVVVGKDRWGHFDLNGKVELAYDPYDVTTAPKEQQNTILAGRWDDMTPEVGSGVHVRVSVDAHLKGDSPPFDGSVVCSITLVFFDMGEGETNDTVTETDIELALGDSHTVPYNLVSDDTVPERASGFITVRNAYALLV